MEYPQVRLDEVPTSELISFIGYFENRIERLAKKGLDGEEKAWKAETVHRYNYYLGEFEGEFHARCVGLNIQL